MVLPGVILNRQPSIIQLWKVFYNHKMFTRLAKNQTLALGLSFQYCTIANYIILKTILIYDFREFIRLAIHWGCLIYFSDVVIMN